VLGILAARVIARVILRVGHENITVAIAMGAIALNMRARVVQIRATAIVVSVDKARI
jgi:hypothetical protein